MPDVLVIGGSGLLGQHLVGEAKARGLPVQATYSGEAIPGGIRMDLADFPRTVETLRRLRPGIVLLAAAMTDVDGCESNPDRASAINADAPREIAKVCASRGSRLLHFSTDYVFDGAAEVAYGEEADPKPISAYGRTKLAGERNVLAALPSALLIRTSANFGWNRLRRKTNAVTWILERLRRREEVPLFTDQWVTPSYGPEVARAAFDLLDRDKRGLFHVGSRDGLSRLEMGRAVCEVFGLAEGFLKPIRLVDLPLKAPRPRRACLAVGKAERFLDIQLPTFRDALVHMRDHE
ncbi:MAG: dTDP-4-dehydrorhamnose reductase [Thermoplasmata archaeon]